MSDQNLYRSVVEAIRRTRQHVMAAGPLVDRPHVIIELSPKDYDRFRWEMGQANDPMAPVPRVYRDDTVHIEGSVIRAKVPA